MKNHKQYFEDHEPLAVRLAYEVIEMHNQLLDLKRENEELREYREKYNDELAQGIAHGQRMMAGLLDLALTPGVLEAVSDSNKNNP